MVLIILQWNARSLIANGQEFKKYVEDVKEKPNVICVQETWLIPRLDFNIKGYNAVRRDRKNGKGGGIMTFIQKGLQYKEIKKGEELEYVTVEVWVKEGNIKIINFYNPCNQLKSSQLEEIWKNLEGRVIWCGDFNAHSTLWGDKDDINGNVLEEFIEEKELICLNDGTCTRIDISRGKESAIDLTFGTRNVADKCEWEVSRGNTVGSDHYPIKVYIGVEIEKEKEVKVEKWFEEKADWEKFKELSEEWLSCVDGSENIEVLTREIRSSIIAAANATIPKSKPKLLNKIVPWWSRECKEDIKERNKAFRLLKRTHNFQHLIEYKRAQAMVRQNVRKAKRGVLEEVL